MATIETRLAGRADHHDRSTELSDALAYSPDAIVMATIGGDTCMDLLAVTDFSALARHGATLCGYSDISVLHLAGQHAGLTSLMGPMLMTQFGDRSGCDQFTWTNFRKAVEFVRGGASELILPSPGYRLSPHEPWGSPTEGIRIARSCRGPEILQQGTASGPLITANVAALDTVLGTPHQPSLEGTILGIETAENQSTYELRRLLIRLRALGIVDQLSGLLVGRVADNGMIDDATLSQIVFELGPVDAPVVLNMPFGHVDPIVTVPLGAMCELRALNSTVHCALFR
jgi:muramoyltetrapeptide carboxypeptidase